MKENSVSHPTFPRIKNMTLLWWDSNERNDELCIHVKYINIVPPCSHYQRAACSSCYAPTCHILSLSLTIYGNDRKISVTPQNGSLNSNSWTAKANQSRKQSTSSPFMVVNKWEMGSIRVIKFKLCGTEKSNWPPNSWMSRCYSWANHS